MSMPDSLVGLEAHLRETADLLRRAHEDGAVTYARDTAPKYVIDLYRMLFPSPDSRTADSSDPESMVQHIADHVERLRKVSNDANERGAEARSQLSAVRKEANDAKRESAEYRKVIEFNAAQLDKAISQGNEVHRYAHKWAASIVGEPIAAPLTPEGTYSRLARVGQYVSELKTGAKPKEAKPKEAKPKTDAPDGGPARDSWAKATDSEPGERPKTPELQDIVREFWPAVEQVAELFRKGRGK